MRGMSQLYLIKEFSEMDGLELCVVHWTVTRIGAAPDWQTARALVLQPANRGSVRQGVARARPRRRRPLDAASFLRLDPPRRMAERPGLFRGSRRAAGRISRPQR